MAEVYLVRVRASVVLACSCGTWAFGQSGGWLIAAHPAVVSPDQPITEIRVFAWFERVPGLAELFRWGNYRVTASAPAFLDFYTPPGILGPDPPHPPQPTSIEDLFAGQSHAPPRFIGSEANPILVLVARWRPSDFTPRVVTMSVLNRPEAPLWVFKSIEGTEYTRIDNPSSDTCLIDVVGECYADCDSTTGPGALDIFDFLCFQSRFVEGRPYACDCDTGTGPGVCDIFDFLCFQNAFAAGCP